MAGRALAHGAIASSFRHRDDGREQATRWRPWADARTARMSVSGGRDRAGHARNDDGALRRRASESRRAPPRSIGCAGPSARAGLFPPDARATPAVTISRNSKRLLPMLGEILGHEIWKARRSSTPSVSTRSIRLASSAASIAACAGVLAPAPATGRRRGRLSVRVRRTALPTSACTSMGQRQAAVHFRDRWRRRRARTPARLVEPARPASRVSSSSPSAMGRICGSSIARPRPAAEKPPAARGSRAASAAAA